LAGAGGARGISSASSSFLWRGKGPVRDGRHRIRTSKPGAGGPGGIGHRGRAVCRGCTRLSALGVEGFSTRAGIERMQTKIQATGAPPRQNNARGFEGGESERERIFGVGGGGADQPPTGAVFHPQAKKKENSCWRGAGCEAMPNLRRRKQRGGGAWPLAILGAGQGARGGGRAHRTLFGIGHTPGKKHFCGKISWHRKCLAPLPGGVPASKEAEIRGWREGGN